MGKSQNLHHFPSMSPPGHSGEHTWHLGSGNKNTKTQNQLQKLDKTNTYDTEICSTFCLNATMTEISGSAGRQEAPVDQPPSVHPYSRRTWHQDDKTKTSLENLFQPAAIFTTQPLFVGFVSLLVCWFLP